MSKGIWDRMMHWIGFTDDEEEEDEFEEEILSSRPAASRSSTTSLAAVPDELSSRRRRTTTLYALPSPSPAGGRITVFQPRVYDDVQEIVDQLKQGRPALVNLQLAEREPASRIVNFLSGATYALNANMHRIAEGILLFAPEQVDVQLPVEGIRLEGR